MNRRDFFKVALGLLGAATLPGISLIEDGAPIGDFVSIDAVRRARDSLRDNAVLVNDGWYCFIHPDTERHLLQLSARAAWKAEYRRARMELKKMFSGALRSGEIGSYTGIRFIVSERLPT